MSRLAESYGLEAPAAGRLQRLGVLLATDPEAPTSLRNPRSIYNDHLADSLVALELPVVREATTIADLGSGAGLPGLCLAIARPSSRVWLIESNARKCRFIAGAIHAIGLANAFVACTRAEAWADGHGCCELVTARALAALPVVAEYAAPLLKPGGALLAWRGRRDPDEERTAAAAARELGLEVADPIRVEPYPGAVNRHLHVMIKTEPTPSRYPRRPGMARKRPLGVPRRGHD